jgi:hypothetical protein
MEKCWYFESTDRPAFPEIIETLNQLKNTSDNEALRVHILHDENVPLSDEEE